MSCVFRDTIVCSGKNIRIRTRCGRYFFVQTWHMLSPEVYFDRNMTRPVNKWYNDDDICSSINWLTNRGNVG